MTKGYKPTYEELEQTLRIKESQEQIISKEIVNYKTQIRELQKKLKELDKKPPQPNILKPNELIYAYSQGEPFDKLFALLETNLPPERIKEELGELKKHFPREHLSISWHNVFGDKTPSDIDDMLHNLEGRKPELTQEQKDAIDNYN